MVRMKLCGWILLAGSLAGARIAGAGEPAGATTDAPVPLKVQRLEGALDKIVPREATLQRIATGYKWTEGPVWVANGTGSLFFTDIYGNRICRWSAENGVSVFMQRSGYRGETAFKGPEAGSNGMTLDVQGRLTVAGHAGRTIWRLEWLDGAATATVLADTYEGKKLNSPNDLVYRSDGSLYFTDPPYGLPKQGKDAGKEMAVNGVYRIPAALMQASGAAPQREKLQLLISDLPNPNGIAFSPDEKYLYVDNYEPKRMWMRYPVKRDGTLGKGKVFYDMSDEPGKEAPDGIKVDMKGNVYSTGPGGVWVFSPKGRHIGTLLIPERVGNLNWGGAENKTLYIAASHSVYRVRLKVAGTKLEVH